MYDKKKYYVQFMDVSVMFWNLWGENTTAVVKKALKVMNSLFY